MMLFKRMLPQALVMSVGLSVSVGACADSLATYSDALKSTGHFLSTLKQGHPLLQLGSDHLTATNIFRRTT